ncbi:hypothetical protein ABNQ39_36700 (plasmid) [Azospirillum sp. A26]|uniref:hypothetical protein n=1 Tax=Azospirillum sp. A26 TaxID=3160607 RepID=UPI00366EE343
MTKRHPLEWRNGLQGLELAWTLPRTIVVSTLTDHGMDVVSRRGFLLNQVDGPVDAIIADGTNNQRGACVAVTERRRLQWWSFFSFTRKTGAATESQPTQRDRHLWVPPISGAWRGGSVHFTAYVLSWKPAPAVTPT